MTRYLADIYKIEMPENWQAIHDDVSEATEDVLKMHGKDVDFQRQIQGGSLEELAVRINRKAHEDAAGMNLCPEFFDLLNNEMESPVRRALIIAFVQGAKYWEHEKENATMWQSDQNKAEAQAVFLLRNGILGRGAQ